MPKCRAELVISGYAKIKFIVLSPNPNYRYFHFSTWWEHGKALIPAIVTKLSAKLMLSVYTRIIILVHLMDLVIWECMYIRIGERSKIPE